MLVWIHLACIERDLGRIDICSQICDRVLAMDPNNEKAYELKGDLCKEHGMMDKAFIFYSKAAEANPESSNAITNLAHIYH